MKTYIKKIILDSDICDFIGNRQELIDIIGVDSLKSMLFELLHSYYSTKVHSTYPSYSHMNKFYRYSVIDKIDELINNKVNKLIL